MPELATDITKISRVGESTAKRLKLLGITSVRDLLFYFPFRYDDFSKKSLISELIVGQSASVIGQIELIQNKKSFKRRMSITEALVSDESGQLKVIWFNQPFIAKNLAVGNRVSLAGKVDKDYSGAVMTSPTYEKVMGEGGLHTQGVVPNYHLTANVTQKQLRFLIKQVIGSANKVEDWLPLEIRQKEKLLSLAEALFQVHFPKTQAEVESARRRLGFDELFLVQLQAQLIKKNLQTNQAPVIGFDQELTKQFVETLPFKLTDAQRKASWEIIQDLNKDRPMSRLLEGDVGSGKTLVATIALLNVAKAGYQGCLMVPTEILANQHYATLKKILEPLGVSVSILTGSNKSANKNNKKEQGGDQVITADITIGTHALIQPTVRFKNLALVVIDEQHRFGVEQRKTLLANSGLAEQIPHLLSMTATPIPRSLALALYGDLDLSIINELPADRKKIITRVLIEEERHKAYSFIKSQVLAGRQVFIICPLVNPDDIGGKKSVKEEFEKLDQEIFRDISIGMLHGKMKPKEKDQAMADFKEKKTMILVSTSVIEVGVDVPNATVMMIEGAENFGLAQLHQFRGRVGRGEHQSYCLLMSAISGQGLKRLQALEKHHDGFALAKIDLKFRGPGEVYGSLQKGFLDLQIASLFDLPLMKQAKLAAERLIDSLGNETINSRYPYLAEKLGEWENRIHLE